jgi:hypothetical protein
VNFPSRPNAYSEVDLTYSTRTAASIFLHSVYGYELKSDDDPFFVDIMVLNDHIAKAAMPSRKLMQSLFDYIY